MKADVGRLMLIGNLADIPFFQLGEPGTSEDLQKRIIGCTRFIFAFSFYALSPERVEIRDLGGPILKDAKRNPVKRQGKPVYLWQYKDMSVVYRRDVGADPRGPLDKTGLELPGDFATMMISSGENLGWVQKMMGHTTLKMITDKYFSYVPNMTHNDGSKFMEEYSKAGEKRGPNVAHAQE